MADYDEGRAREAARELLTMTVKPDVYDQPFGELEVWRALTPLQQFLAVGVLCGASASMVEGLRRLVPGWSPDDWLAAVGPNVVEGLV